MDLKTQQLVWSVIRWAARGALALAAVTFILQWLLPKLRKWYRLYCEQTKITNLAGVVLLAYKITKHSILNHPTFSAHIKRKHYNAENNDQKKKQDSVLQELQKKHQAKAASYKERILLPREEAKKQQKEEEFYKFMGPAWKGKGEVLGADEDQRAVNEELDEFEEDLNPREMAAVRRRIQKPTPQPPKPPQKQKRVVTLPDEPTETDVDSVLVLLRSPIHTVYQRRFRHSHTVQVLLDFMTMSGFSQTYNTLCTSFPRHDLAQNKDATLLELGFTGRVTLNIEEKEL